MSRKRRYFLSGIVTMMTGLALVLAACGAKKPAATLSFESFDGGGPEYTLVGGDRDLFTYTVDYRYDKADHAEMTGAGYSVVYTFTGLKPGVTTFTVEGRSPIAGNETWEYELTVEKDLSVTIRETGHSEFNGMQPVPSLMGMFDDEEFLIALSDDPLSGAFVEALSTGSVEIHLALTEGAILIGGPISDLAGADESTALSEGDVAIGADGRLVVCLSSSQVKGTKIARIPRSALPGIDRITDDLSITLWVEWSE